jgi:N-acetyltransferase 10
VGLVFCRYSNIFVTAPSPENLKTLFDFVFKGFDAMDYKEHIDYELVESTNPAFNKAIVRVNIFRQHRQTIQVLSAFIFESSSSPSILKIQVLLDYI